MSPALLGEDPIQPGLLNLLLRYQTNPVSHLLVCVLFCRLVAWYNLCKLRVFPQLVHHTLCSSHFAFDVCQIVVTQQSKRYLLPVLPSYDVWFWHVLTERVHYFPQAFLSASSVFSLRRRWTAAPLCHACMASPCKHGLMIIEASC